MINYVVTTRAKDGSLEERAYTAEDRSDLFKQLTADGINAVRIREGVLGKKSRKTTTGAGVSKGVWGVVAAVVVVAICVLILMVIPNSDSKIVDIEKPKKEKIVSPKIEKVFIKEPIEPIVEKVTNVVEKLDINKLRRDDKGKVVYNPDAPVGSPANPIKFGYVDRPGNHRPPKKLFETFPENYLVGLMRTKPGMPVVNIRLPPNFDKTFMAHLADPVVFKEDDTPEDMEMRRRVKEIKDQMAAMIAQGATPSEILLAERQELNKLANIKSTVLKEIATLRKAGASDEEIDLSVEAGNKLLEQYGIEHIKIPIFLRANNLNKITEGEN